ncbi:hypothetical protein B0H19DRAFT_1075668 [Mycena capillaripes]|nr:hypothetical protein B0H19DRAFT_1075668 [Mycena capillaripes]
MYNVALQIGECSNDFLQPVWKVYRGPGGGSWAGAGGREPRHGPAVSRDYSLLNTNTFSLEELDGQGLYEYQRSCKLNTRSAKALESTLTSSAGRYLQARKTKGVILGANQTPRRPKMQASSSTRPTAKRRLSNASYERQKKKKRDVYNEAVAGMHDLEMDFIY